MNRPREHRRISAPLLVSIAVHLVLGAGILRLLALPHPLFRELRREAVPVRPAEQIAYVRVPALQAHPGRSGGDGKPVSPRAVRARPRLRAPVVTPAAIPAPAPATPPTAPPDAKSGAGGGSGAVVGAGGAVVGMVPAFADPRIWSPRPYIAAPKTLAERLDSGVVAAVGAYEDSVAAARPTGRAPGDWTLGSGSRKFGMDDRNIYVAGHAIPAAILGLLPLGARLQGRLQGNPVLNERERLYQHNSAIISMQAQRAMVDDEFREAVKRIAARKERERREAAERQAVPPASLP